MANSTRSFAKLAARALRLSLLSTFCLAVGIVAHDIRDSYRPSAKAQTAVSVLAQHAEQHWLEDDPLALQTLVRHTHALPAVRYAAIFDAAKTPISERGISDVISEANLHSAPIMIGSSEVGVAVLAFEPQTEPSTWWLLLLAPMIGLLSFIQWKPSPSANAPTTATPLIPRCVAIVALKHPLNASQWQQMTRKAEYVAKLYGAELDIGAGYLCFNVGGDDAISQSLLLSRLWYGAYYATCRKTHSPIEAAVYLSLIPSFENDTDKNHWLFDTVCQAANTDGVAIAPEFAQDPETTEVAIIARQDTRYRLKKLCDSKDLHIKKQLAELLENDTL